jgi:hypothetical protein
MINTRPMRVVYHSGLLAIGILVGCSQSASSAHTPKRLSDSSRQILDTSEQFVLFSLEPVRQSLSRTNTLESFHGYPILGHAEIKDTKTKGELLAALHKGIEDSNGLAKGCFNPRHGIRASNGTNWIELVICFECAYMNDLPQLDASWRQASLEIAPARSRAWRMPVFVAKIGGKPLWAQPTSTLMNTPTSSTIRGCLDITPNQVDIQICIITC